MTWQSESSTSLTDETFQLNGHLKPETLGRTSLELSQCCNPDTNYFMPKDHFKKGLKVRKEKYLTVKTKLPLPHGLCAIQSRGSNYQYIIWHFTAPRFAIIELAAAWLPYRHSFS